MKKKIIASWIEENYCKLDYELFLNFEEFEH